MIAVTGSTGKLGRLVIEQLLTQAGAGPIVAVTRSPEKAADIAEKGIEIRWADYGRPESLGPAFAGADVLLFVSNTDFAQREKQHQNVVDAALKAGVNRIVYTSFIRTGKADPLSESHAATEDYIEQSALPFTFLRNNFYVDLYTSEVEIAMKNGVYRSPTRIDKGASLVSRLDIARVAAAVLTGGGHEGKAYDLTGPASVTPAVIAKTAGALSGKAVGVESITWEQLGEAYRGRGIPSQVIPVLVNLEQMIESNVLSGVSDDIARLTGELPEDFLSSMRTLTSSANH
jgi:NAD(P)H dehydrogenase (quinone)